KQYENGLGISKNSGKAFDLYSKVSNTFEFYLNIYYNKSQNIKGIELILAERVKNGL
ncbi:38392_t:CDS:2, partial [Gigaspora margarita]